MYHLENLLESQLITCEKAQMVAQILKRDRAEEFHFYNCTARNYSPFRLTTATYKLRVLLHD